MKYVLDTNAVSAIMRADERLLMRLDDLERVDVGVPQPVLAEIAYGIESLPRSSRKETLRTKFGLIRAELAVVAWSDAVTDAFGIIKARLAKSGQLIEDFDIAVAAHALANKKILVTANVKHMIRIAGLDIEDWSAP